MVAADLVVVKPRVAAVVYAVAVLAALAAAAAVVVVVVAAAVAVVVAVVAAVVVAVAAAVANCFPKQGAVGASRRRSAFGRQIEAIYPFVPDMVRFYLSEAPVLEQRVEEGDHPQCPHGR